MEKSQYNRDDVINNFLNIMAPIVTDKEYIKLSEILNTASDEDLFILVNKCEEKAKKHHIGTVKKYGELINKIRKAKGINTHNSADNCRHMSICDNETSRTIFKRLRVTKPSDYISISDKEEKALLSLWCNNPAETGVPSDIFFAGQVPMLDCYITADETETEGHIFRFRVHIYDDYMERIKASGDDDATEVGILEIELPHCETATELMVIPGYDNLCCGAIAIDQKKPNLKYIPNIPLQKLGCSLTNYLQTWYSLQIAFLHPNIKTVFSNPSLRKIKEGAHHSGKQKRITKYVKKHIIKLEDINTATHKAYERKTLVWYVIGHWRCYKDGRKTFIHPYWKGALRKLKRDFDDRERIIDIPQKGVM